MQPHIHSIKKVEEVEVRGTQWAALNIPCVCVSDERIIVVYFWSVIGTFGTGGHYGAHTCGANGTRAERVASDAAHSTGIIGARVDCRKPPLRSSVIHRYRNDNSRDL